MRAASFRCATTGVAAPVFMGRFGLAYKAELAYYLDQCVAGAPFAVDHGAGKWGVAKKERGNQS